MPLTPNGRREAEIEKAVHEWNLRHVVKLSGSYGLSAHHRSDLAETLDGGPVDQADRARVIADVWREGLRTATSGAPPSSAARTRSLPALTRRGTGPDMERSPGASDSRRS